MYHCQLHIHLAGQPCRTFEMLRELPPKEHFTHIFQEDMQDAKADAVFVNLQGADAAELLKSVLSQLEKETELIVIAEQEQKNAILTYLPVVSDLWVLPMTEEELQFRIQKWQ